VSAIAVAPTITPVPAPAVAAGAPGPRTPEGRAASARNSLRHGLSARELVLPGEDPAAYDALLHSLLDAHLPAPGVETLLVHQIAQAQWRLDRARRNELQAFEADRTAPAGQPSQLDRLLRYIAAIEREFHRAIRDLLALQNARTRRETTATKAQTALITAQTKNLNARTREHHANFDRYLERTLGPIRPTTTTSNDNNNAKLQNELPPENYKTIFTEIARRHPRP
jgi:hypothetical protein